MSDMLSLFFGAKRKRRKVKKSPGRKPKRGHGVKKLSRKAFIMVRGRKRKLYRGSNGGLYYRTKSGRRYVHPKMLRRKSVAMKALRKRRARKGGRKKMTKKAIAARKAYKKRMARKSLFGFF